MRVGLGCNTALLAASPSPSPACPLPRCPCTSSPWLHRNLPQQSPPSLTPLPPPLHLVPLPCTQDRPTLAAVHYSTAQPQRPHPLSPPWPSSQTHLGCPAVLPQRCHPLVRVLHLHHTGLQLVSELPAVQQRYKQHLRAAAHITAVGAKQSHRAQKSM